jgi:hypothetical protein
MFYQNYIMKLFFKNLKNAKLYYLFFCIIYISLLLCSCTISVEERIRKADQIFLGSNFKKVLINSGNFVLTTYQNITNNNSPYIFYVEGDGFPLINPYSISDNPTPVNHVLLRLVRLDPRDNIIYIARPCQFTDPSLNDLCKYSKYWIDARMSLEVVDSMASAIRQIAKDRPIKLIGFSGGGGIVMLLVPQLKNIQNIITIAGNLDISEFAKLRKSKPISESLNPIDFIEQTKNIPQLHISGGKDKVVPVSIRDKFVEYSNSRCVKKLTIDNATHARGWEQVWNKILKMPISCD